LLFPCLGEGGLADRRAAPPEEEVYQGDDLAEDALLPLGGGIQGPGVVQPLEGPLKVLLCGGEPEQPEEQGNQQVEGAAVLDVGPRTPADGHQAESLQDFDGLPQGVPPHSELGHELRLCGKVGPQGDGSLGDGLGNLGHNFKGNPPTGEGRESDRRWRGWHRTSPSDEDKRLLFTKGYLPSYEKTSAMSRKAPPRGGDETNLFENDKNMTKTPKEC